MHTCPTSSLQKGIVPEDLKAEIMKELSMVCTFLRHRLCSFLILAISQRGNDEKSKPLSRKLVRRLSVHFIPPECSMEEKALHILSLARVKFRIRQVGCVFELCHHCIITNSCI